MTTCPTSARWPALLLLPLVSLALSACEPAASIEVSDAAASSPAAPAAPAVAAATPEAAGRYLVTVAGCNDCHTEGFLFDPSVPESAWLTGSRMGFRGPWGTSYPTNLRLTAANLTEDQWVERLKGQGLPPMPWPSVNAMAEADARSLYRYIRSLGAPGEPVPAPVGPEVEPTTPWLDFTPRNLPAPPTAG